ncbi:hypothetical protein [Candidatus Phytoplasma solani]|nr:hypothetical protein [Candidatus Phytoplasma solani]
MDDDIVDDDNKIEVNFVPATPITPEKRNEKLKALVDKIKKESKDDPF